MTSLSQIYEWESMVLVMKEQKDDTLEETFYKMSLKDYVDEFKAKETKQRRIYYFSLFATVLLAIFDFFNPSFTV